MSSSIKLLQLFSSLLNQIPNQSLRIGLFNTLNSLNTHILLQEHRISLLEKQLADIQKKLNIENYNIAVKEKDKKN